MKKIWNSFHIYDYTVPRWIVLSLILAPAIMLSLHTPLFAHEHEPLPERPDMPIRPGMPHRHDGAHSQGMNIVPTSKAKRTNPAGAWIELQLVGPQAKYWSEVEWVDGDGNWHTVDGWRGYSTAGVVRWFVEKNDLAKGPFRWRVFTEQDGILLTTGKPFSLPSETGVIVALQGQVK